jgi:CDP-diacylglycerol--glycerol-3-phosphate 3-phosphatidyltransferase
MHPWRERLARWFTPLARRSPLSPNAITGIALLLNLAAAVCLDRGTRNPPLFLLAVGLIAVGGLADAFDGIVARVQNKATKFGDFLDHVADRVSDTAISAAWMLGSGVRAELTVIALILVGMNGYIGTQIEATYNVRNYENLGRGEFVLALVIFPIVSYILATNGWMALRFASVSVPEWLTIALIAFALFAIAQRIGLARQLERDR